MAKGNRLDYDNVPGFPFSASAYESVSTAEQVDMLRRLETLEHLVAKQVEEDLKEKTINKHGVPMSRMDPLPGAISVVSDQDILDAVKIMWANGFHTFESQIETAIFSKVLTIVNDEGKNYVEPTPVDSSFTLLTLRSAQGSMLRRTLRGRINIVDPVFENGGNGIPPAYIRGVLNVLNAFKLFNAMDTKQISLQDLLAKLQTSSTRITQAVVTMMGIWKAKTVPATVDNLRAWQMHALIHERVHFLIHALPANDLPEGNDPETQAQRERLMNITFEKYMEMIFPEGWAKGKYDIYLETAIGAKNIYKALQSIKSMPPGSKAELTFKQICAIEMYCDRFAMFLAENAAKQEIYKAALKESKWPFTPEKLGQAHAAQEGGNAAMGEFFKKHGAPEGVDTALLIKQLKDAEKGHVLITQFGDPPLTAEERAFFQTFWQHVQHFDADGTINTYSKKHCESPEKGGSTLIYLSDQDILRNAGVSIISTLEAEANKSGA